MATSNSARPPGFGWLRATYRPSAEEVAAYAEVIARAEGQPELATDVHLREEAELQLWIWRTETRTRPSRVPRAQAVTRISPAR
jgi:hypothetical protein